MTPTIAEHSLEDDLRVLRAYDEQIHVKQRQRDVRFVLLMALTGLLALAALWTEDMLLRLVLMVAGVCSLVFAVEAQWGQRHFVFPEEELKRVAASGLPEVSEMLSRFDADAGGRNSTMPREERAAIHAALKTYFETIPTTSGVFEGKAGEYWDKMVQHWGGYSPDVAIAIIEAFVRLNDARILSKLLLLDHEEAPTSNMKRVREAARDAIPLLSARADFGSKQDIPAQIDEYHKLVGMDQNSLVFRAERPLWLRHALTFLLPTLSKQDTAVLDKSHRERLRWLLRQFSGTSVSAIGRSDAEFKQAVLLCLGNIEDVDAIPAISTLAHMDAPMSYEQETRALARKQLARLQKIQSKLAVGETLLRASSAPATGQDQLLRPAALTEETQADLLLRPHAEGGKDNS